jgi:hypothetical protein
MSKKTPQTPPPSVAEPGTETLLLLDPADVLADDNSRFDLKPLRIESLGNDIMEKGEVTTPVEVEAIEGATAAPHYRLTAGFYRHAAASKLNAEQNAGVLLPARLKNIGDPVTRLRRQLAENMERENQSPMDKAIAIKKLLDAGVSRQEVRRIFSTPGGRKGLKLQAASNSFLNIELNLLDLPKSIQKDIHDGIIGVAAAYELGKVPPDKRQAVVDRAKADYIRQIDIEEKDEAKLLDAEKKLTSAEAETATLAEQIAAAEKEQSEAIDNHMAKVEVLRKIQKEPLGDGRSYLELKPEEKNKFSETLKAAETDVKSAEKLIKESGKAVDKLKGKAVSVSKAAESAKAKIEAARKLPTKKKAGVSKSAVQKAAKAEGVGQTVKLNANEMRQVIEELAGGEHAVPKVSQIGVIIKECFDGISTPKQMVGKLYAHMGLPVPTR